LVVRKSLLTHDEEEKKQILCRDRCESSLLNDGLAKGLILMPATT
jgi:hypothetical protein